MYKKCISFLLVFMLIFSCSVIVFAQVSTTENQINKEKNDENKKIDDIILERGDILTHEDFVEIRVEMENSKKSLTDEQIKKLIIEKIKDKEKMLDPTITPKYTIWGMNLNASELALVILYPIQAVYVYSDAQEALEEAENLYEPSTLYQGNGDAFRHAYWNALMVDDVGEVFAILFANAHEAETPDGIDKTMDLYNNELVGI